MSDFNQTYKCLECREIFTLPLDKRPTCPACGGFYVDEVYDPVDESESEE